MKKSKNKFTKCEIEDTLNIIGNKWTVLIIRDLLEGTRRFGELQKSLVGISPRILAERLARLEANKIITKKIYPVSPPHTDYTLTKHGQAIEGVLDEIKVWNKKYRVAVPQS